MQWPASDDDANDDDSDDDVASDDAGLKWLKVLRQEQQKQEHKGCQS